MHIHQLVTSPSKQLAAILGGFCFGVLVGPLFVAVPFEWMIGAMTFLGIACVMVFHKATVRSILLVTLVMLFGIFRYTQSELPPSVLTVADKAGQTIRIEGIVSGEVEQKINGQSVVLNHVEVADESVDGKLLVRLSLYPQVAINDRIQLSCRLKEPEPFNGFAYDRFLKSKGVLATCSFPQFVDVERSTTFSFVGSLLGLKHQLVDHLKAVITEPHASFLAGLLFGGSSGLSRDLQDDFSKTGTSHILAASGFNVSLFSVAFLGWILTTKLKRRNALLVAASLLVIYMIVAGATPAIVRATIMAGLVLIQHAVRREPFKLNMLLLAATAMLLANPRILLDDPGFQLSFVATASILYLVPLWKDRFDFLPDRFGLRESFVASLVASIATAPIVLWHFGAISFISPLVNMLVLPLVPYAMILTTAAMLASVIWVPLGQLVAIPALAFSTVMLKLIAIFGSITFGSMRVRDNNL